MTDTQALRRRPHTRVHPRRRAHAAAAPRPCRIRTDDGVTLVVHDTGASAATERTIIFLHGLCLDHTTWKSQISCLQAEYGATVRLISYDHRGHGASGKAPPWTYTVSRLGDDLRNILTALRVTSPLTVVGHSMGAMAALSFLSRPAAEIPLYPSGLVLAATAAGKLSQRGIGRLLSTRAITGLAYAVGHTPQIVLRGVAKPVCVTLTQAGNLVHASNIASIPSAAFTTIAHGTAIGYLDSLRSYDRYAGLPNIKARTVVVSGGADLITPPQHARDLAAAIPRANHLHVPAAGHMLPRQAPEVITQAIRYAAMLASSDGQLAHSAHPAPTRSTRKRDHLRWPATYPPRKEGTCDAC